jgi:hypothetical protein
MTRSRWLAVLALVAIVVAWHAGRYAEVQSRRSERTSMWRAGG